MALAALRLIERDGLAALTMRRVASELGCGTMSLYSHVSGREELLSAVVEILINQVDVRSVTGETWQEAARRMLTSYRELAYRYPRAFELLALARDDEWPVAPYLVRLLGVFVDAGLQIHAARATLSVLDAYASGFLVMAVRSTPGTGAAETARVSGWAELREMQSLDMFDHGIDVIIAGLEQTLD